MFMHSTVTQKDLILYFYRETNPKQTEEIENALESDWELRDELDSFKEVGEFLDHGFRNPDPASERIILDYASKKLPIEKAN